MNYSINSLLLTPTQLLAFIHILHTRKLWNEHELLKTIAAEFEREMPNFNDPLSLFHSHFVLFNALYRLIADENFTATITLKLTSIELSEANPQHINAELMAYYLDEENLITTTRTMLGNMLENFGEAFTHYLDSQHKISNSDKGDSDTQNRANLRKLPSTHKKPNDVTR